MMEEVVQLTKEERLAVKPMWSEIFYADSDRFTDYYFAEKMSDNKGYGVKVDGKIVAMMFLTPYPVWIKTGGMDESACAVGQNPEKVEAHDPENVESGDFMQVTLYYIVGVGTRKKYRHRGYMDRMLKRALRDICAEGHPFTFLMPADPAIYEPYQFRYIYDRPVYTVNSSTEIQAASYSRKTAVKACDYETVAAPLTTSEIPQLVQFSNDILMSRFQIFVHRDSAYYERQRLESAAQNGDVYLWKNNGEIQGYYLYAKEDEHEEIQEAMLSLEFPDQSVLSVSREKKPIIMARIANVRAMLSMIRMREDKEKKLIIRVHDPLIEENNGTFLWTLSHEKSEAVDITQEPQDSVVGIMQKTEKGLQNKVYITQEAGENLQIKVDITFLLDMLFGRAQLPEALAGIKPLTEICINEIV